MRYIINGCTDPWFNMALDEWCLMNAPAGETLCYLWRNAPSVIIGFNQDARAEVNLDFLQEKGILLARRVTGGGAVYHDLQNLNYSFIRPLPPSDRIDEHPAEVLMIADALRSFGVDAQVSGRNDIFVDGHKISGYARRVWRDRELIHGTLMWDVDLDTLTRALDTPESKLHRKGVASVRSRVTNLKDLLPRFSTVLELRDALYKALGSPGATTLTEAQLAEVRAIRDSKFASPDWIYGRL